MPVVATDASIKGDSSESNSNESNSESVNTDAFDFSKVDKKTKNWVHKQGKATWYGEDLYEYMYSCKICVPPADELPWEAFVEHVLRNHAI